MIRARERVVLMGRKKAQRGTKGEMVGLQAGGLEEYHGERGGFTEKSITSRRGAEAQRRAFNHGKHGRHGRGRRL